MILLRKRPLVGRQKTRLHDESVAFHSEVRDTALEMKVPRRLLPFVRPRRLIAAGLFVFFAYLFANNLDPTSLYEVKTGAKSPSLLADWIHGGSKRSWACLEHVDDDGRQVTVARPSRDRDTRCVLRIWDAESGVIVTPAHWSDPEWQVMLGQGSNAYGNSVDLLKLFPNGTGRELLHNSTVWSTLGRRLSVD
jgi:hypothetical protein